MFETEIKEIRNKLARSLRLWRKAKRLEREIKKNKYDVYWICYDVEGKGGIYEQAENEINKRLGNISKLQPCYNLKWSKRFKKYCEEVQNIKK